MKTFFTIKTYFLTVCCILPYFIAAQEAKEEPTFFTGISPIILERNATEIAVMNNLNSVWLAYSKFNPTTQVVQVADRQRFTRVENLVRFTYGFSKNKNWDLGAEIRFAHARLDESARSSPFEVLKSATEQSNDVFQTDNSYHGLSNVGLRFRFMPISSMPELTLQLTHHRPLASSASARYAFGFQRAQTGLTATYFIQSGDNIYYFFQADWIMSHKSLDKHFNGHDPALGAYMVIRTWENQWYIFPGINYSASLSGTFYKLQNRFFGNIGVLYQPSPKLSFLMNWQAPLIMDSGNRYVEFVKASYTGFSIGLRSLLEPR